MLKEKIASVFSFLWKYRIEAVGLLGLILITVFVFVLMKKKINSLHKEKQVIEHNLKVSQDSLRAVKSKEGDIEYNRLGYLTDKVENLYKINQELAASIKLIKGQVNAVVKTEVKIVEKPVPFYVEGEITDTLSTVFFSLDTVYSPGNYKKYTGFTVANRVTGEMKAQKLYDEVGVSFIVGIKNQDKGSPEIFLKSDYPGLTVTNLEGAVIDPSLFSANKKSKTPLITPGITVGWTPVVWNNKDQRLAINSRSFGVTAGLSFNILKLLKLKK